MVRIWFGYLLFVALSGCATGGGQPERSKYIGSSASVVERDLDVMSMPVVKIQTNTDGEIWHYFPSESDVRHCTKYVAIRGNYSDPKEYRLFLSCFKQSDVCGYVFRRKDGVVTEFELIQNSKNECPHL